MDSNSNQIIWTRSLDDWEQDQRLFQAFSGKVLHYPCIKTVFKDFRVPDHRPNTVAYVFSSATGVKSFLHDKEFSKILPSQLVFAIGEKTRALLNQNGIQPLPATTYHKLEDLGLWIISHKEYQHVYFYSCGAAQRAFAFSEYLLKHHFHCEDITTYQTLHTLELSDSQVEFTRQFFRGFICFASPSAVSAFVATLQDLRSPIFQNACAIAIGETTAKALRPYFNNCKIIEKPTVELLASTAIKLAFHEDQTQ